MQFLRDELFLASMLLFPGMLLKIDQDMYRTARAAGGLCTMFVHRAAFANSNHGVAAPQTS